MHKGDEKIGVCDDMDDLRQMHASGGNLKETLRGRDLWSTSTRMDTPLVAFFRTRSRQRMIRKEMQVN